MSTVSFSELAVEAAKVAAEAEQLEQEYQQKKADLMSRLSRLLGTTTAVAVPKSVVSPASSIKRGPGRPKTLAAASTPVAEEGAKRRGRPKGSKNKAKAGIQPSERNYTNKISLREAIWKVLDMGPDGWAKHLPDLPADAEGLKAAEIREMIAATKIWESASGDITSQVQQHLHNLMRKENKIARGDDRRYYIIEGAEL